MAITNFDQSYIAGDDLFNAKTYENDRRLRHRLEVQTGQIEKVFARNQVPVEVTGGAIRPEALRFDMKVHLQDGLDRLRIIKNDLISALGVTDVRLNRNDGRVKLSVGRSHPHAVDLLDLHAIAPAEEGVTVILGLDGEGKMILLNLGDKGMGNILVSGTNAAGKSGLLRTFAVSLALANRQSKAQLGIIAAPSGHSGFITRPNLIQPLNYLPHVLFPVVSSTEESVEALQFLTDELTYREETGLDWPLLVILIDNVDVLLERGDYAIHSLLTRLAGASPDAGIRLVLSATDPDSGDLGRILKHNVSLRLTGRTVRQRDQRRVDDTIYFNGQGDFLAESYGAKVRFQAAFIDDYDLHLTLEELHRRHKNILLAQFQSQMAEGRDVGDRDKERVFIFDKVNGTVMLDQEQAELDQVVDLFEDERDPADWLEEIEAVKQTDVLVAREKNPVEIEPESSDIIHLNAGGNAGRVSVIKAQALETEYSEFEDDWRLNNEDDGNEQFRHYH